MTDQRARAERLLTDLIQLVATDGGYFNDPEKAYAVAMAALADERRRVWEEAAKLMCPFCNDPEWITYDPKGDHISPHTGTVFVCKSRKIRAKAHAGQEG